MMNDRKHLVLTEISRLIAATRGSRNEARDRCLLLLMFRHGLRVSEACGLKMSQVDIESRVLHVARLKKGLSTTQPLRMDEVRAVKAWLAERKRWNPDTDAFFVSERRTPLSRKTAWLAERKRWNPETDAFFVSERRQPLSRKTAWVSIRAYGEKAGLSVAAHPHMLRHACGFALADQGADTRLIQDYLGHRNIQHTVIYTATNPARFEKLWR